MRINFSEIYCSLLTCSLYPRLRRIVLSLVFPYASSSLRPLYALYHIRWLLRVLLVCCCVFALLTVLFVRKKFIKRKLERRSTGFQMGRNYIPTIPANGRFWQTLRLQQYEDFEGYVRKNF